MAEKLARTLSSPPSSSSSRLSPRCELDADGCLSVAGILAAFTAPIKEEQAWALFYQSAKCLQNEWLRERRRCFLITETSHLKIHKDGFVHPSSVIFPPDEDNSRERATSEIKLISKLGCVIYQALDYGYTEDEERNLSPPLEALIDNMIVTDSEDSISDADGHETDEGIEEDHGEMDDSRNSHNYTFEKVIECCCNHLNNPQQADGHYKAVCRALVAEALELTMFLQQVSNGTQGLCFSAHQNVQSSKDLDNLHIQDWARLWVQVIHELRRGVKLKKVDPNPQPIEYALTPYEILMDDIRRRRYKLNKVMINGDIPRKVKKDAHAIILEFIRSRPPLIPVSKRKLPPKPPFIPNAYEKLMNSIRSEPKLKPTPMKSVPSSWTKSTEGETKPQPTRLLIKADMKLLNFNSSDQEDDDDLLTPDTDQPEQISESELKSPWLKTVTRDMTIHSEVIMPERRHSLGSFTSTNNRVEMSISMATLSQFSSSSITNNATTISNSNSSLSFHHKPFSLSRDIYAQTSNPLLQSMIRQSSLSDCLSLTLEEVVHIRSELTKAELETMLADTPHYNDILNRKLCFTCRKTRFAMFGPWGNKCKLCTRTVCDKCCSKMRIPTEHFASIPVYTLSPSPSPASDDGPSWRLMDLAGFLTGSSGSVPTSPTTPTKANHRKSNTPPSSLPPIPSLDTNCETHSMASLPVIPTANESWKENSKATPVAVKRRAPLLRSWTVRKTERPSLEHQEKLRGSLMTICKECKAMMCHTIMASRGSLGAKQKTAATFPRRIKGPPLSSQSNGSKPSRDLHLDLSSIY